MNERIKALADQAGIAVWGDAVYMYHPTDTLDSTVMEKFAELIVRECVNKIVIEQDNADQNWSCKNGVHIAWEMLDHFGVDK